jgi:cysteine desulfurase
MVRLPIYLDNHATTRCDPRVVEAMLPYFSEQFGNASSSNHSFGHEAREAVESARVTIASLINAPARNIVFTSGATESNNLVIRGVAENARRRGDHLVTVTTEHKAVLDPMRHLTRHGFELSLIDVEQHDGQTPGRLDPQRVADTLRDDTALVSVMLANNEIGIIHDIPAIAKICHSWGVPLHVDATQAVGKIPVDVEQLGVDAMSFSSHKIYGPKGGGGLYVRKRAPLARLEPQMDGGGQEGGLRSGTLNVPGIVGFATAASLCAREMAGEAVRVRQLRDRLWRGLIDALPDVLLNGPPLDSKNSQRLDGNLNVHFPGVDGEALMLHVRDIAVSSGAACTSANPEPSHVLRALGCSEDRTRASLRFGIGRFNTAEEIDFAVAAVSETVRTLRRLKE